MEINFHVHILKIYMRQKMPKYPHSSVQWTRQQKRSENFSNIFSKKKKDRKSFKIVRYGGQIDEFCEFGACDKFFKNSPL
jgi:hypothetical protein